MTAPASGQAAAAPGSGAGAGTVAGAAAGAAAGALAAAVEGLLLAALSRVPGGPLDALAVSLVDAAVCAALGGAIGRVVQRATRRVDLGAGAATAIVGGVLVAWTVLGLHRAERDLLAVAAVSLVALGAAATVTGVRLFAARLRDRPVALALLAPTAALLALAPAVKAVATSTRSGSSASAGAAAHSDRPSVLLVTIDTLRRDAVGVYGGRGTPHLDALAARGTRFDDAVTPMPETAPAHATMFTGLHPLRHRVISNGHALAGGFSTVAEALTGAGYATAAFTSSYAVDARTGLDAGFATYDDDLAPGRGFAQLGLSRLVTWAWMVKGDPARTPWLVDRRGEDTTDAAIAWLGPHADEPFFLWVHLFEPHAPYESHGALDPARATLAERYAGEVTEADLQLGRIIGALESSPAHGRTLVVVAGDHGEMLGEHGLEATHVGLYDEVVRVPLVVTPPALPAVPVVAAQVRLTDVAATLLAFTGVAPLAETEGVSLLDYASGKRTKSLGTALVGRKARSFSDGVLVGARNNGTKYMRDLVAGDEHLFDLGADPSELTDLAATRPDDLARARDLVAPDAITFGKLAGVPGEGGVGAGPGVGAMLEALGYTQ